MQSPSSLHSSPEIQFVPPLEALSLGKSRTVVGVIRLGTVVLGAENVERAVGFWTAALGYDPVRFENSANEFTILVPPSKEGMRVAVQRSETPVQNAPRVHLDLVVDSADEQEAEVKRLVELGGEVVDWDYPPDDPDFIVLADTEGNRFCIVNANA